MNFDSLNPYQSLEYIVGIDPQDLRDKLKQIRTPIKIIGIVSQGSSLVAFIIGDIRKNELPKQKSKKGA